MNDTANLFSKLLSLALTENNLQLSHHLQNQLVNYLLLLQKWNKTFNLTSITDPKEMVYLHLIDSLLINPYLSGKRFLDVGSGAGLPGIPLALTNDKQHWTLLDKNSKKTRFLTQVIAELDLKNVAVVKERCEDFQPADGFDSIISRAYGSLLYFKESTEHLLNDDGVFIAMKGKYPVDEIQELKSHVNFIETIAIKMHGMKTERHIVLFKEK